MTNTLGSAPLLATSLFASIFTLIFLYFTNILNTETKFVLFVMAATGSFDAKRLFKNNYPKKSSRIVNFL